MENRVLCKSHSIANTCWHRFHVRPHLVNAQQVIVLRVAVDFFYQEAKAQKRPMNSTSRSRYMPTRYNSQVQLIHNIAITYISTLWNSRAHLKQSETWRRTVDKKNKTQQNTLPHTHIYKRTYTPCGCGQCRALPPLSFQHIDITITFRKNIGRKAASP